MAREHDNRVATLWTRRRLTAGAVLFAMAACVAPPPGVPHPVPIDPQIYPWLADWDGDPPPTASLETVFPTPPGFARVEADPGSFGAWLRGLPVRLDRTAVLAFNGAPLPSHASGVIVLDVGEQDLQQCADTLIRLHAEWLWSQGRAGDAAYHFTSGDESSWAAWVAGERFRVSGSRVTRLGGPERTNDHATYRQWLQHLFNYAGTLSLRLDSDPVSPAEALQPGDFFVDPGSPGHTVMILDVAVSAEGTRLGIVGQGYTPAQELHVLADPSSSRAEAAWFELPSRGSEVLDVPSWSPFPRDRARRFHEP
jgi:hypothetical protein